MNKSLLKDITRPDALTTTLKVLFGVSLLVGIAKTTTEIYFKIQDRKKQSSYP